MKTFNLNFIRLLMLPTLVLSRTFSINFDGNNGGWECLEPDRSIGNTFQTNLKTLLNTLSVNGPLHNGYHKDTSGKNPDKVYGLLQCRGDASPQKCANCTQEAIKAAQQSCSRSRDVAVWLKFCFLHYSNESFFGILDPTATSPGLGNETRLEDPVVVSHGKAFMNGLASTAANQARMFRGGMLDVGEKGKRYGTVQCNGDLSRSNCSKCLVDHLELFQSYIEDKREWNIYGKSCSLGYSDLQLGLDVGVPAPNDGSLTRPFYGVMAYIITYVVLLWVL